MRNRFNNLELQVLGRLQGIEDQIVSFGDLIVDSRPGVFTVSTTPHVC
jgi:hypothetical protein